MLKKGIFNRLSNAGCRIGKKPESWKALSRDSVFESCSVIDADFVEVNEDFFCDPDASSELNSKPIDSGVVENLREYLKTRSHEEISEIFEEIRKILESRVSERDFREVSEEGIPINKKTKIKEISKNAFNFFSETASCGKQRIISASKVASSKASALASERTESIMDSSKKLNEKWNNLSPRDRKIISELIITMIEIGLLKNSTRGKKATFAILSSISRHQTPGKKDLEEFVEGLQKLFKRRR